MLWDYGLMFAPQRGEHFPGSVCSSWVETGSGVASRDGLGKKMKTQKLGAQSCQQPLPSGALLFRSTVSLSKHSFGWHFDFDLCD